MDQLERKAEEIQQRCYENGWVAWEKMNPETVPQEKGAFMMGFQMGLLAAELTVGSKVLDAAKLEASANG